MHMRTLKRSALLAMAATTVVSVAAPVAQAQTTFTQRMKIVSSLDVSPDASLLVTGGEDVRIFEAESGRLLHTLDVPRLTRVVRFSPTNAELFATGGDDGTIRLWRVSKTEPR